MSAAFAERTCRCGSTFVPKVKHQIHCKDLCRGRANQKPVPRKKAPIKEIRCLGCEKLVEVDPNARGPLPRYCPGKKCCARYNARQARYRKRLTGLGWKQTNAGFDLWQPPQGGKSLSLDEAIERVGPYRWKERRRKNAMKLEWRRMTGEVAGTCNPCGQSTNRLISFRKPGEINWECLVLCDDCHEGIKNVAVRPRSDA